MHKNENALPKETPILSKNPFKEEKNKRKPFRQNKIIKIVLLTKSRSCEGKTWLEKGRDRKSSAEETEMEREG